MWVKKVLLAGVALFHGIILGMRIRQDVLEGVALYKAEKRAAKEFYYEAIMFDHLNVHCYPMNANRIYRCRPDQIDVAHLLSRIDASINPGQHSQLTDVTPNTFELFCQAKTTLNIQYLDVYPHSYKGKDDTEQLLARWTSNQQVVQSCLSNHLPPVIHSLIIDSFYDSDDFYRIYTWTDKIDSIYVIVYSDQHVNQTIVHYIKL